MFIDEVQIRVHSGDGGNGCISFRREKFIPHGGPDGGNGGRGGDVHFLATRNKHSLLDFKYQPIFRASRGRHGMGSDMDGRSGEDLTIQVPLGTRIYDRHTNELLSDLVEENVITTIAKGGRGGRGNRTFTTSTRQAPRIATPGAAGQMRELRLELQLIADVGLVGLPNAGKSSLLSRLSRARPKVADYPFTTLQPCLGVVGHKGNNVVVADLPGLIEGAAEGQGLGHQFLRHASRTSLLLHLVEATVEVETICERIELICKELAQHSSDLEKRTQWLVFTKCDLLTEETLSQIKKQLHGQGLEGHFISSHSGYGLDALLDRLIAFKKPEPEPEPESEEDPS